MSRTEVGLTRTFLLMRTTIYFFLIPLLRTIWYREPLPPFAPVSAPSPLTLILNRKLRACLVLFGRTCSCSTRPSLALLPRPSTSTGATSVSKTTLFTRCSPG